MIDFIRRHNTLRNFLRQIKILPHSLKRSGKDRRTQGERRVRTCHEYLTTVAADRRFEPDRRKQYDRRSGGGYDF